MSQHAVPTRTLSLQCYSVNQCLEDYYRQCSVAAVTAEFMTATVAAHTAHMTRNPPAFCVSSYPGLFLAVVCLPCTHGTWKVKIAVVHLPYLPLIFHHMGSQER